MDNKSNIDIFGYKKDNQSTFSKIEANFFPLKSYISALESIVLAYTDDDKEIPFAPTYDILDKLRFYVAEINSALKDL